MSAPRKKGRAGDKETRARKFLVGVAGALLLSIVGSGIWEYVFRPGIGRFSEYVISLSQWASDSVYTSAALDPTPVTSLILLLFLAQLPAFAAMWFFIYGVVGPKIDRVLDGELAGVTADARTGEEAAELKLNHLRRRRFQVSIGGAIVMALFFAFAYYAAAIHSKSVLVWRVFNQNVEVCDPHLSELERMQLRASFRLMHDEKDFLVVRAKLDEVARRNGVALNWFGL